MPSKSPKQAQTMRAAVENPQKIGIPRKVAEEFVAADNKKKKKKKKGNA